MRVKADEMRTMSHEMLVLAGATEEEVEIITDVLVDTSLRGIDSHGVRAITRYISELQSGKLQSEAPIKVLRDGPTSAMWDAGAAIGYVASARWVHEYDNAAVDDGRIAPVSFGGVTNEYKGYGIKVILEALCGAIGVGCSLDEKGFGCLFMAIDPSAYCDIQDFKARVDSMISHVKSSSKRGGFQEILMPGEPELIEKEKQLQEGIYIDDVFWEHIVKKVDELGMDINKYVTA